MKLALILLIASVARTEDVYLTCTVMTIQDKSDNRISSSSTKEARSITHHSAKLTDGDWKVNVSCVDSLFNRTFVLDFSCPSSAKDGTIDYRVNSRSDIHSFSLNKHSDVLSVKGYVNGTLFMTSDRDTCKAILRDMS